MDASSVLTFRLNIVCEEDKNISWDVDGSWTIDNVKAKIQDMEGIHPDQQRLFYEGEEIRRGESCLFDLKEFWYECEVVLNISMEIMWLDPMTTRERDEARSRSRSRSRSPFGGRIQIFVKVMGGKSITLDVKASDTIDDLKAQIEDREGISGELYRLTFNGKQLEDDRTVSDYNIQRDSVLRFCGRLLGFVLNYSKIVVYFYKK